MKDSFDYEILSEAMTESEILSGLEIVDRFVSEKPKDTFFQDMPLDGFFGPALIQRLTEILEGDVEVYFTNVVVSRPGQVPLTGTWHLDRPPPGGGPGVKATFHLTDSRKGGGALELKDRIIEADRGDILIARVDLLHRSGTPCVSWPTTRKTLHASFRRAPE